MPNEPLEITIDGPLLELARRAAEAEGISVEDWVIQRLANHASSQQPTTQDQAE